MDLRIREMAGERLLGGAAWRDFLAVLQAAGDVVDQLGSEVTELDRVEWYRFLTRLTRHGLHRYVENSEPERPRLIEVPWRHAINFQSPDQDHLIAEFFDGVHDYRITGNRGTVPYIVMVAWEGGFPEDHGARDWAPSGAAGLAEFDPAVMNATAFLGSDAMHFEDNGDFTIVCSRERPAEARNWLPIKDSTKGVLVRTLYHLREESIAPTMRIERLDGGKPRPLLASELSGGLARAGQIVFGYAELVKRWWLDYRRRSTNRVFFDLAFYLANGGVADRHHGFGTWECGEDEALVVEFTPGACDYWILQLCNMWQENFDNYEDGQGYLQKYRVRYEAEGLVRAVISHRDPGLDCNWVDLFGHVHGGWSLRLIRPDGAPPELAVWRLPLARLEAEGWTALAGAAPIVSGGLHE